MKPLPRHPRPELDYWLDQSKLAALDVELLSRELTRRPQLTYPTRCELSASWWYWQQQLAALALLLLALAGCSFPKTIHLTADAGDAGAAEQHTSHFAPSSPRGAADAAGVVRLAARDGSVDVRRAPPRRTPASTQAHDAGVDAGDAAQLVDDAGDDAGHDAGHDAGVDAGHDAGHHAGSGGAPPCQPAFSCQ